MLSSSIVPPVSRVWAPLALTLFAFALRIYHLGSQSLWYDEGFSIWLAGKSLAEITGGDFNPPFFHYTLHFWLQLTGSTEFAVRFLSLLPGVLLVPVTCALGRRLFDALTGIIAALIVSTSPFLLWYSQEARMYTLVGFLVTLSSYLLIRALLALVPGGKAPSRDRGPVEARGSAAPHPSAWIGYTLATIAAVYAHYYAFLILPVHGLLALWWTWRWRRPQPMMSWLAAQGGLIVALMPWTPFLLQHYRAQTTTYWPGALSLSFIARRALFDFVGGSLLDDQTTRRVAVGYLALVLIGLLTALLEVVTQPIMSRRIGGDRSHKAGLSPRRLSSWPSSIRPSFSSVGSGLFLVVYLAIPLFLTYVLTHNRPKFFPRYLLFLSPAFFVLAATGVRTFLRPRRLGVWFILLGSALTLSLCLLLGSAALALRNWFTDPGYGKDDFRAVGHYLQTVVAVDDAVILSSGHAFPVFTYYYPRSDWYPIPTDPTPAPSATDPLPPAIGAELNRIADGRRGLWLVLWQNEVVDPNGVLGALLDQVGRRLPVGEAFRGIEVRHYALPPAAHFPERAEPQHPIDVRLTGDLVLLGYDVLNDPVPSDEAVDLILFWRAVGPTEEDYRISLRLRDRGGHQVGQLDRRPAGFMYPTSLWKSGEEVLGRHALPLPPALPPGSFALELILYPAADVSQAESLTLGQVTVVRPKRPPRLDELNIPYLATALFGPLKLLGHDVASADMLPGDALEITLFWHATAMPPVNYEMAIILGESQMVPLVFPYPTSQWQAGDIFQTRHRLVLPADLPAGEMPVYIRVDAPAGSPLASPATLAMLRVGSREHRFDMPAHIQHPLRADLAGYVTFLGDDREAKTLRPGETLHLILYWQARREMDVSYTVFTHLLGGDGLVWGQHDGIPLRGSRPTTSWLPGEVLMDTYDITVHPDAPPGDYVIEGGMYNALSGERLPVFDESGRRVPDDRILLGQVRVAVSREIPP